MPHKVGGARFNMCSKVESFIFLFAHMRVLMCIDVKVGEPGKNEPHHPPLGHTMRDGWMDGGCDGPKSTTFPIGF